LSNEKNKILFMLKNFIGLLKQIKGKVDKGLLEKDPTYFQDVSDDLGLAIQKFQQETKSSVCRIKTFSFCDDCSSVLMGVYQHCPVCKSQIRIVGTDQAIIEGQYFQELFDFFEQEVPAELERLLSSLAWKGYRIDTHIVGPKVKKEMGG